MRLDKYIAETTGFSRAISQRTIKQKRVAVDGVVTNRPAQHVTDGQVVTLDGAPLDTPQPRYLMLHKPAGCVCSTDDPTHPSVLDLLDIDNLRGLHFAGRLDLEATGLVLITDDGNWSHRITSPRHKVAKTYSVTLAVPLPDEAVKKLLAGVQLNNEKGISAATQLELLTDTEARITITEGKYHQVKRMFGAVGNRVLELHRESIGELGLDEELEPGEYRELTEPEIALFTAP
ncbi:MAG: 16S rRNA pseudouridine(516) synthase RsuA [Gammaproteobacteria bacterium]